MKRSTSVLALVFLGIFGLGPDAYGQGCSVDNITINSLPCFNNGTSQPDDDTYIVDFTITFSNRPTTGNLELLAKGQNFSSSVLGMMTGTAATFQFLSTSMPADGLPLQATARFTADAGCTLTKTVGTAPAACSPTCSITGLTASFAACDNNGTRQISDDFSNTDFTARFSNPPTIGDLVLDVGGQTRRISAAGLATQHQFPDIPLSANGQPVMATARFTAIPSCTLTANVGSAPTACPELTPVPALSRWVIIPLILVFLAGGIVVLRRRKNALLE
jgi:hypothetical protein